MRKDHHACSEQIKYCHTGHQIFRDPCYFIDSSKDHQNCKDTNHQSCHCPVDSKSHCQCLRNRIPLRHIPHAKGGKYCEYCKQYRKDPPHASIRKCILKNIHGATHRFPLVISYTIPDTQRTFHQLGRQPDDPGQKHPEQCSRSS